MKYKNILFILVLIVFLFNIAAASAGDANATQYWIAVTVS